MIWGSSRHRSENVRREREMCRLFSCTKTTWEGGILFSSLRVTLFINKWFGRFQKCHWKRGVTVNGVTVSGEVCISSFDKSYHLSLTRSAPLYGQFSLDKTWTLQAGSSVFVLCTKKDDNGKVRRSVNKSALVWMILEKSGKIVSKAIGIWHPWLMHFYMQYGTTCINMHVHWDAIFYYPLH